MPRQANGTYQAPANTAAVSGQTVSSTAFNTLETDIGTEITNSVDRGGRSAMTAALPMGANKITGMADPAVATDAATKNYVDTTVAAFFSTGDVKPTFKIVPDSGWLMLDDGTFGSASSSSSNSNNASNLALFTLFFNAPFTDASVPIFTSGGGATTRAAQVSASAAWAANCRMSLPKSLGRALGVAGAGASLTTRVLGSTTGAEIATIAQNQLPNVALSYSGGASVSSTVNNVVQGSIFTANNGAGIAMGALSIGVTSGSVASTGTSSGSTSSINGSVAQQPISIMDPTVYLNVMVKQ